MVRFERFGTVVALSIGLALAASSARADMQVLDSNVAKYPREALIKGNTISDLGPRQWVRVRMLQDNSTQEFGTQPPLRPPIATRGPRRQPD
jgi:hypothetical protein